MRTADLLSLSRTRALARSGNARRIREAAGLSASEVAEALKTSPMNVSRWERGERVPRGELGLRYGELLQQLREVAEVGA